MATALTRDGRSGFAITGGGEVGNTLTASLPFIWMAGGDIVSADLTTATVNQPGAVEGVTFFTDFYKKGLSPASTLENDNNTNRRLFIAEAVSSYLGGQFDLAAIAQREPRHRHRHHDDAASRGQGYFGRARRLELRDPGRGEQPGRGEAVPGSS